MTHAFEPTTPSLLGKPIRITGDVRVAFRGSGRARFRLQHTADRDGEPDELSWCDVSNLSNRDLADPADAIDANGFVSGFLVDVVDGDLDVLYRRHAANWLRAVPLDEDDAANTEACTRYAIAVEPLA
jgi:hypothetical protein